MKLNFAKISVHALIGTTLLVSAPMAQANDRDKAAGAIIGAIIGAAAGNQVGNGSGRDAATAVGAVVGAIIGAEAAERDHRGPVRPDRPNPPRYPDRPREPVRPDHPRHPGTPYPGNPPPYNPAPPRGGYYESSAIISSITRRVGGEWVRIQFDRPVLVDSVIVQTHRAGLRIHQGTYHTDRGQTFDIRNFYRTGVAYEGQALYSERLPSYDYITSIDLLVESMGGYADAYVRILTYDSPIYPRVIRY